MDETRVLQLAHKLREASFEVRACEQVVANGQRNTGDWIAAMHALEQAEVDACVAEAELLNAVQS